MEQVVVFAIKLIEILGAVVILLGAVAFVIGFLLSALRTWLLNWIAKQGDKCGKRSEEPRRRNND